MALFDSHQQSEQDHERPLASSQPRIHLRLNMFNLRPGPFLFPFNLFSGSPKPKQGIPLVSPKIATNPALVVEGGSPAAIPCTPFPPPPRRKRVGRERSSLLNLDAARRVRIQRSMRKDRPSAPPAKRHDLPRFEALRSAVRNITGAAPAPASEEQIFRDQLKHLEMHREIRKHLVDARESTERAKEDAPLLGQKRVKRVEVAQRIRAQLEPKGRADRQEEQRLMSEAERVARRQAEEKKKADELSRIRMRKFREELREERRMFAQAREAARRREERARADSARRRAQELRAQKERADQAAARFAATRAAFERERVAQEIRDRTRRLAQEAEAQRWQRANAQAELERQKQEWRHRLCAHFKLYDDKWDVLKGPCELPPLDFVQLPWPILTDIRTSDEVTLSAMKDFIFHPERLSFVGKTPKERIRTELLRWHPDKFNAKVLGRVAQEQQADVQEAAGRVARFLNEMLAEIEADVDTMMV